jgi:hypothetical protein
MPIWIASVPLLGALFSAIRDRVPQSLLTRFISFPPGTTWLHTGTKVLAALSFRLLKRLLGVSAGLARQGTSFDIEIPLLGFESKQDFRRVKN